MNARAYALLGSGVATAVIVAGVILSLQNFDAQKVACDGIAEARAQVQGLYDTGVSAAVQVFADQKAEIDERLSQCLSAKPADPCADAQQARDAAVSGFNGISSPPESAPYEEFQIYFSQRDTAYNAYKAAKAALDQCRTQNPPKPDVPYEKSDTKACFDAYDASTESARDTFNKDTQTMRTALSAALAGLDAREKACNPPTGAEQFTDPIRVGGGEGVGFTPEEIRSCKLLDPLLDGELSALRQKVAELSTEIEAMSTSITHIEKRMSPLKVALGDVETYIPPEATKTQFEGALNGIRAERKVALEASLDFYKGMLERRQGEKLALEQALAEVNAQIDARLTYITEENAARERQFPTALHQAKPDKCDYYHCHGMLCGRPDPEGDGCGHGATTEADVECKDFLKAFFEQMGN